MTIFAVICAGIFPAIHVGRAWFVYWLAPYPNQMSIWPNFRSPLLWDMFAVGTYVTVSLLFWYLGMIPDLATLRDRATTPAAADSPTACSPWAGAARPGTGTSTSGPTCCWPALATPLVLSVHSVVSFDFAVSHLPGWHTTIFPPYFVAGAIFSGFAMVVTLMVPARAFFGLKELVTMRHLDNMNKIILVTGCMVAYAYAHRVLHRLVQRQPLREYAFLNRACGPLRLGLLDDGHCNVLAPQLFWFRNWRHHAVEDVRSWRSWSTSACGWSGS